MNDSSLDGSRNPLAYRGWSVVLGSFVCAMLAVGGSVYIFGLFVIPVSEAFDLSRADVNNGLTLTLIGTAIWSPILGRLIDRFSARLVIAVGALLYAVGFFTIASSSSLWLISLAIRGPVAMGVAAAAQSPPTPSRRAGFVAAEVEQSAFWPLRPPPAGS